MIDNSFIIVRRTVLHLYAKEALEDANGSFHVLNTEDNSAIATWITAVEDSLTGSSLRILINQAATMWLT